MRTNGIENRTKLLEWIRQKTGVSVGGSILASWNATRIRPDSQMGPVKYPTFKGDMAFIAVDGSNVHILRLGKVEFHARNECPAGTPSLEELLFQKPSCALLKGDQVPTTINKGKTELDCRRILNAAEGEIYTDIINYTGVINGCDFVADVTALLNRPGAMTPGNLVAELVNGNKERALKFLDEQLNQQEFIQRVLEFLKDLPEAQAGKAHKALRNTSGKLKERIVENLLLEVQAVPTGSPRLVRRFFLAGCCCIISLIVAIPRLPINQPINLIWLPLGVVCLVVALIKDNNIQKRKWVEKQLAILTTPDANPQVNAPQSQATISAESHGWTSSVLPEVLIVIVIVSAGFACRFFLK